MIKHLIWDLDGTLFDTYPAFTSAFLATLADFGHYPEPEFVLELMQVNLTYCASALADTYQLSQAIVEQRFSQHYSQIPYSQQPVMPGAYALCTYIASSEGKNAIVTHRQRRSTIDLLDAHSLRSLIIDLITGDDDSPRKPDPTSFQTIIARNDLMTTETLSIGDRPLDIAAGQAAGVRTCLLGNLKILDKPDYRVDHLEELLEIVQRENQTGSDSSGNNTNAG